MLRFFYNKPANITSIDSLENIYKVKFENLQSNQPGIDAAISYGKQMATAIIEWSKEDGASSAATVYTPMGEA